MKLFVYIQNTPPPVKASIAFLVMSIIEKGLVFITSPIYTRLLTQNEFGQVAVFLSWLSLIGVVAMFCLSAGVFNNGMLDHEHDRDGFSFSMLILSNIVTALCFVIILVVWPYAKLILDIDLPLLYLMFFVFFTQPAFNFWMTRQRFEYKYKLLSTVVLSYAFLSPLTAIVCIYLFPFHKVYGRLFGGESILLCVYFAFYLYTGAKAKWKINTSYWKAAVLFNLPLIPHYLSGYVLNNSNRIIIANLVDNAAAAKYSVAYTIALAVTMVWSAVNGSLIPYTYEKCRSSDFKSIANITGPILILYAAMCGVLILLAPEMLRIMAPASYYESVYIIPPLVGGVFFTSMYFVFANVVYYYKKPKYVMFASVTAAALNIALNWFLIPKFGYFAAGYTTLFCYLAQAVFDYYAMKKVVGKSIYIMRLLMGLGAAMICISMVSSLLYRSDALRYGLIIFVSILAIIFRGKVLEVIKQVKK